LSKNQHTADIWKKLCEEFDLRRKEASPADYTAVIEGFVTSARGVLESRPTKLAEAVEIAGDAAWQAGLLSEASRYFRECLTAYRGAELWDSAMRVSSKRAELYFRQQRYEKAIAMYQGALECTDLGELPDARLGLLNGLGSASRLAGQRGAAISAYREAMKVVASSYGESHPEFATVANNLGVACSDAGDLLQAENLHLQALAIRERSFGGLHPDVAQSLANLAVVYHTTKDYEKAEQYYKAALETYRRFPQDDAGDLTAVQENYEALLRDKGRL